MPRKTIREQIKHLAIFVVTKHPNWVSYTKVSLYMNCSATKARELCKTLAEAEPSFEYHDGSIRFTDDPENWKFMPLSEDK